MNDRKCFPIDSLFLKVFCDLKNGFLINNGKYLNNFIQMCNSGGDYDEKSSSSNADSMYDISNSVWINNVWW